MSRPVAEIHETEEGERFYFTCPSEYCDEFNVDPYIEVDLGVPKEFNFVATCRGCGGKFAAKYMNDEESK
jgi:hypothetical protein